jgi:hypothetical protein
MWRLIKQNYDKHIKRMEKCKGIVVEEELFSKTFDTL